jgi:hypothetical protein
MGRKVVVSLNARCVRMAKVEMVHGAFDWSRWLKIGAQAPGKGSSVVGSLDVEQQPGKGGSLLGHPGWQSRRMREEANGPGCCAAREGGGPWWARPILLG